VIGLEVVGVTARPKSDEQKQRERAEFAQAVAEHPGPPLSDQQKRHLMEQAQALGEYPDTWVRLKERTGDRVLEFGIGPAEAQSIAMALHRQPQPRPMTHDLIGNLLGALDDVSVLRVVITKLERETNLGPVSSVGTPAHPPPGTFHGALELRHREDVITVDCRPSDGIAVAIRLGVPILAADELEPVLAAV
jgi:bifunctional DNase/RNase